MSKERAKKIAKKALAESNRLFYDTDKSHAYIIGYLEGYLKLIIEELENS